MKKVYTGLIYEDSYGFLAVGKKNYFDESLAEVVNNDWIPGTAVTLRYYISTQPMTEDEAVLRLIHKLYSGLIEVQYKLDAYSEYTIMEWEEGLEIGGHPLIKELASHCGKYLVLVIEDAQC